MWKKKNEYKFILASDSLHTAYVYINNKELSSYYKTVEINNSTFSLEVTFSTRNYSETLKIFINDTVIFNEKLDGESKREGSTFSYNIRKTFNTSILDSNKINMIKVVIA